jgi:aspartate aminotransferase
MAPAPVDPFFGTLIAYMADKDPNKINVGVGAYRTDDEKPYVFDIVKKVEKEISLDLLSEKIDKEYLPIDGDPKFRELTKKLVFGANCEHLSRITTIQTVSGLGSLRVGFEFLRKFLPAIVYVPQPTWITHHSIIEEAGLQLLEYPYYNSKTRGFNFNGMIQSLQNLPKKSIVLLHVAAHNPTGVDPSKEQWTQIAEIMKSKQLIPYFDFAYQGFASGCLEADAFPVRHFLEKGLQMLVSQSFAKNLGLYGERIGALHVVCQNNKTADIVLSQLKLVARSMWSNPPIHGMYIVTRILSNEQYFQEWKDELKSVAGRLAEVRFLLRNELERLKTPGTWDHITSQIGMFSYTGLSEKQCEILTNNFHVYLLKNGRISLVNRF